MTEEKDNKTVSQPKLWKPTNKELLESLTDEELEKEMARRDDIKRAVSKQDILAKQRVRHRAELIAECVIDENTTEEDLIDILYETYRSKNYEKELTASTLMKLEKAKAILGAIPRRIVLKAKRKMATYLII